MARPGVHAFWVDKIRVMVANEPGMSGVEVRRRLLNRQLVKGEPTPPTPVPSDRAIRRIMERFKELPRAEQQPYTVFSWPESMELGALPWEASRAALDLLRLRTDKRFGPPLIREALWFWHVTQAAPDAELGIRRDLAAYLAMQKMQKMQDVTSTGTSSSASPRSLQLSPAPTVAGTSPP